VNIEKRYKILLGSLKWILISVLIGITTGSASAFFSNCTDWVTNCREHNWLIWLLPLGGLLIGYGYYYGARCSKGNNLLLEE
jgi:H+/Cl- antiporter ClcA